MKAQQARRFDPRFISLAGRRRLSLLSRDQPLPTKGITHASSSFYSPVLRRLGILGSRCGIILPSPSASVTTYRFVLAEEAKAFLPVADNFAQVEPSHDRLLVGERTASLRGEHHPGRCQDRRGVWAVDGRGTEAQHPQASAEAA
jgi:hypothetical protein